MNLKFTRGIMISVLILGGFALAGVGLLAVVEENSRERIVENRREQVLRALRQILPESRYDNELLKDTLQVRDPLLSSGDEPVTIYRARKHGQPVAVLIEPAAPDGYNGRIQLLVGIEYDGTLLGVRVAHHQETPGLGDAIEVERDDWILDFDGRSLQHPDATQGGWQVKKDGGEFDQFTGATITPRAVVGAVRKTLQYYRDNRDRLFATGSTTKE